MAQGFFKSGMNINVQKPDNSSYQSVSDTNKMIKSSVSNMNQQSFQATKTYSNSLRNQITEELRKQFGHKG